MFIFTSWAISPCINEAVYKNNHENRMKYLFYRYAHIDLGYQYDPTLGKRRFSHDGLRYKRNILRQSSTPDVRVQNVRIFIP
jgi:hypothetical protein